MNLKSKNLLGLSDLDKDEINLIFETADAMKQVINSKHKKTSHLQGKSVLTLFYENSTRTRVSFELASKYMGASNANISLSTSSEKKGESLIDTVRTLDSMAADILIVRHGSSGVPHYIAQHVEASVINAGDGMHEHPTQALLDMYTMREKFSSVEGLTVAICGDILHSRVARSNAIGLAKMGAKLRVSGPKTMIPPDFSAYGCEVCANVKEAVKDAHVIMALRLQLERQSRALFPSIDEYATYYAITNDVVQLAHKDVLIMHPGPCNHGVEMPTSVYESAASVINEQVHNGVAVRMAIMYLLVARRNVG